MALPPWLENGFLTLADQFFALLPQPYPGQDAWDNCRIVSHRGERDGHRVFENTFAAFDPIVAAGIWGIEFDIRWSLDLVPFVIHDADGKRVFGEDLVIANHTAAEIQEALPLVPDLESFVARYGKKVHLMAELKEEVYPNPAYQQTILKKLFSPLIAAVDYHFISLHTDLFQHVAFLEPSAMLPVSTINASQFSRYALQQNLGGVTGHYLFISDRIIRQHNERGMKVGVGFINSRNSLYRELNRGTDWLFSNEALRIQSMVQAALDSSIKPS
ncbi:MAG: hypothetical protein KUG82_14635 [Pseudomonadales bacterium]|nr:hypothetical protein [Pseudomonadales bacterium]